MTFAMGSLLAPTIDAVLLSDTTVTDSHGNSTVTTVETSLAGVLVAPRSGAPGTSSSEVHERDRENHLAEGLTMYVPYLAPVGYRDRVRLPAPFTGTFRVEGEPGPWPIPFTDRYGLEVELRRAQG